MNHKTSKPTTPSSPMTKAASRRIQRTTAKANGGVVAKNSFSARAQRAAVKGSKP